MSPASVSNVRSAATRLVGHAANSLGRTIHDERRRRGWTLRELAARAGLSIAGVQRIESGASGSLESYCRLAVALGPRPEFDLADPRRRDRPERDADPVHAAMGDVWAGQLRRNGFEVAMDEPYQHYQFAGRADVVAWSREARAMLHIEDRTRFPDLQDAFGRFGAKRAYLGPILADRIGIRTGWRSQTHGLVGLWSSEVMHTMRLRSESFRAAGPDDLDVLRRWWDGRPVADGRHATVALFDPVAAGRSDRRRLIGLDELGSARPRYSGYADALAALRRAGLA